VHSWSRPKEAVSQPLHVKGHEHSSAKKITAKKSFCLSMAASSRCTRALLVLSLVAVVASHIAADVAETYQATLTVRQSDIQRCAPVKQLSALKMAIEERESPIMRQVFAWLFPFGPAWNSSASDTCNSPPYTVLLMHPSSRHFLHQLVSFSIILRYCQPLTPQMQSP
jgi:hypothetical protein